MIPVLTVIVGAILGFFVGAVLTGSRATVLRNGGYGAIVGAVVMLILVYVVATSPVR